MSLRIPLATAVLALATACSPSSAPQEAPVATRDGAAAAGPEPGREREATAARPAPQGDCDLLSAAEITGAFEGRLSVKRAGGRGERGSGCTYDLAEVDEAQLILQAGDRNAFELRKENYAGMPLEALDLGEEAWLVNGAQVIAVSAEGDSISLGLQLFTFGQPTPVDPAQARAGLESLARTALERM